MTIRSFAVFIGIGLLGCASPAPEPWVVTPAVPSTVAASAPPPVDVPQPETPTTSALQSPDAPPQPVAAAPAKEAKKKIVAKSPAQPTKPAPAVVAAPPPPPAPPAIAPTPAPSAYSGPDACTLATKSDSSVAAACMRGGVKEARKEMKRMVKKAKDAGHKTDCDDCHPDDDFGKLTKDGREKFKELARLGAM